MKLTHKGTGLPGGDPDTDRVILADGKKCARVLMIDAGSQTGMWRWSGYWSPAEEGRAASLDDALAEIRQTITQAKLDNVPGR